MNVMLYSVIDESICRWILKYITGIYIIYCYITTTLNLGMLFFNSTAKGIKTNWRKPREVVYLWYGFFLDPAGYGCVGWGEYKERIRGMDESNFLCVRWHKHVTALVRIHFWFHKDIWFRDNPRLIRLCCRKKILMHLYKYILL